ncbi:GNAT family N-acetyltransferase [Paenarthrobacter ureafaciens]|uniref:GNAT family N-acetyltransferase n=1 Tax=Paenarthrobacter ureafaciens TaxID=37931 RepID=UPI001FB37A69|nr:hypothetical protein [Paenarthrobacter ureafaciens]UOD83347.1 hypothetical protein MQZ73_20350 [Paenarthrobacter ureafaciens]WNZ04323.1 hypothetical protein PVT25_01830 [Paenarthrobacter ureafaciens]
MVSGLDEIRVGGSTAYVALLNSLDDDTLSYLSKTKDVGRVRTLLSQLQDFQQLNRTAKRGLEPTTLAEYQALDSYFKHIVESTGTEPIERQLVESGHPEIDEALASGLLSVNHEVSNSLFTETSTEFGRIYGGILQDLLNQGNALLLDEQMSDIVEHMIAEGLVRPSETSVSRSTKAGAGAGMIARLPAFPNSRVGQILEARDQLESPLGRYRRAVKEYSQKLRSSPFSPALQDELDDLWLEEVQPSVVDLQHRVSGSTIARETLWEGFAAAKPIVTEAAAALIHFQGPHVGLDQVISTATAATTAVAGIAPPLVKSLRTAKEAKTSNLYYLAALGRILDRA